MKKTTKFLCVIALVFSATFASGQGRYSEEDVLLNAGIGLGYYYGGGGVPLILSGELAVTDIITVGPYLSYTSRDYIGYRYTFFDFGVRGSYHFNELLEIRNEQVDVYGGAALGYLISSVRYDDPANDDDVYPNTLQFGIHVGARYFFNEKVAGYGELGAGLTPLSLGVTFKPDL